MKNLRNAFLGNQSYHHNLLGEEFDRLVEEATEKTRLRPSTEANQNVIIAINDPNTGMELTPQQVSAELRKQMRSSSSQKQWLAVSLVQDVLKECSEHLRPVLMEILETVSIVATRYGSSEASRRTKQVALEILRSHGSEGNQAFRNSSGLVRPTQPTSSSGEPGRSVQLIHHYDPISKQHCEVVKGLIQEQQMRDSPLVVELLREVKEMRKIMVRAIEIIASYSSQEVESAVIIAVGVIEVTDRLFEDFEKLKNTPPEEPDLLDLRSLSSPSLGERAKSVRRPSTDLLGLDGVEDSTKEAQDPFQQLANAHQPDCEPTKPQSSNFNPFHDQKF